MPSTSKKQRNFMAAAAHNPAFAKKVGISSKVAKEFNQADKGRKFGSGGVMKHEDIKLDKKIVKKAVSMHDKQLHGGKSTNLTKLNKGGMTMKKMCGGGKAKRYSGEDGESLVEFETKTGKNKMIDDDTRIKAADYASLDVDAEPRITKDAPKAKASSPKGAKAFTRAETGGGAALMTRKDRSGMPKAKAKSSSYTPDHTMGMAMKKGGSVKSASARADGCAIRGKTRA
jgi:hypothetical protein